MKVGIVTCEKCPLLSDSEKSLIPLLAGAGVKATPLIWNDPAVHWAAFDALIIRSIWDYHLYPDEFAEWLNFLEENKIRTLNPVGVLRRNHHKFYLRDLEKKGIRIIPSLFIEKTPDLKLPDGIIRDWKKAVIKPAVSASGYLTQVFSYAKISNIEKDFRIVASQRDMLVQQFIPDVQESGELSMVFFNRVYSHAILKKPAVGEFRVQKEFGGKSSSFHPGQAMIDAGNKILTLFDQELLYARVDGLVIDSEFILMEVELIEPELFLDNHPEARKRFIEAFLQLAALER